MKDLKYTKMFTKDFIIDMKDYFLKFKNQNTNYVTFNKNISDEVDFDYLKKELLKNNMKLSFEDNEWKIEKF